MRPHSTKIRFLLLACLLVFSRGCDIYSTRLWFFEEGGMQAERNPLTYFFGLGWTGLMLTNALFVGLIIGLLYYYCFRYRRPAHPEFRAANCRELASLHYFNRPDRFSALFYKLPANRRVALAHIGYVATMAGIFVSFMAAFHNVCSYYQYPFYSRFRDWVGRPMYVFYGLMGLSVVLVYWQLMRAEYARYRASS